MERNPEKFFPRMDDSNVLEILFSLLSAESVKERGYVLSKQPVRVGKTLYRPCEVMPPVSLHDIPLEICIHTELRNFYINNDKRIFWRGIEAVLRGIEESSILKQLGKYGLGELFYAFFDLGEIPEEKNPGVSQKLKRMVEGGLFKSKKVVLWPDYHGEIPTKDLYFYVVGAYTNLQKDESPDFWKRGIEIYPEQAQVFFRGLALCSLEKAENYLKDLKEQEKRLLDLKGAELILKVAREYKHAQFNF